MKKTLYKIGGIVALVILGGIIYFGFFAAPAVESPSVEIGASQIGIKIPALNMAPLSEKDFSSLKIFKSLPLAVGTAGNVFPFQEIILIAASETAAIVQ
ncbi:MAG: hypothetical protein PHW53_03150 [Patescibacteria group bacterium]|nr:hypothetical protein [Patescibacteria group bacterium]